jgi:site-specific DNA-cytosine methylase
VHLLTLATVAWASTVAYLLPNNSQYHERSAWFRAGTAPIRFFHSYCCGAGFGDIGLQRAGWVLTRAVECNMTDRRSYEKQHGLFPEPDMLLAPLAPRDTCDLFLFGLPCVTFSSAGLHEGFGNDTNTRALAPSQQQDYNERQHHQPPAKRPKLRNTKDAARALFANFILRLEHEAPRSTILENVLGMASSNQGRGLDHIIKAISSSGFAITKVWAGSSEVGGPSRRPRIFLIALRLDIAVCSSWLLVSFQPRMLQTHRNTFSAPCDFEQRSCTGYELQAQSAHFYAVDDILWITDRTPRPAPFGPEHCRNVVRTCWRDVPAPSRDAQLNCYVIGYIRHQLPTDPRNYRAQHQVYDARGLRPTMTTTGQGGLMFRQNRRRAKHFESLHRNIPLGAGRSFAHHVDGEGNFCIARTSTVKEDLAMLGVTGMILARSVFDQRAQMAKAQDPELLLALGASLHHVLDSAQCLNHAVATPMGFSQQCYRYELHPSLQHLLTPCVPHTIKTVLRTRSDALLPSFDIAVTAFQQKVLARVQHFRRFGSMPTERLQPLFLHMAEHWTSPAFFGHVVDFTGDVPRVVEARDVTHDLRIDTNDPLMQYLIADHDDPNVVQLINQHGFHSSSYHSRMITCLWPDHASAVEQWERLLNDLQAETGTTPPCKLTFGTLTPYAPYVSNPGGAVDKKVDFPGAKPKIRAIEDSSASMHMESVNAWISLKHSWRLQLLAVDDIAERYVHLLPLARRLNERIYMFSTDLSRAYRAAGSAYSCWWLNGSHVVTSEGTFCWMVDTRLSFGNKANPLAFCRVAFLLVHMWTRLNTRTIPDTKIYRSAAMQLLVGTPLALLYPEQQEQARGFTRSRRFHHSDLRTHSHLPCSHGRDIDEATALAATQQQPATTATPTTALLQARPLFVTTWSLGAPHLAPHTPTHALSPTQHQTRPRPHYHPPPPKLSPARTSPARSATTRTQAGACSPTPPAASIASSAPTGHHLVRPTTTSCIKPTTPSCRTTARAPPLTMQTSPSTTQPPSAQPRPRPTSTRNLPRSTTA